MQKVSASDATKTCNLFFTRLNFQRYLQLLQLQLLLLLLWRTSLSKTEAVRDKQTDRQETKKKLEQMGPRSNNGWIGNILHHFIFSLARCIQNSLSLILPILQQPPFSQGRLTWIHLFHFLLDVTFFTFGYCPPPLAKSRWRFTPFCVKYFVWKLQTSIQGIHCCTSTHYQ